MKTTLQTRTAACSLLTVLSFATLVQGETAIQAWVQRYNGPGNGNGWAYAVAVDGGNNVIVTGYSTGSGSARDYATIKYSSKGAPLWTNCYNGPGNGEDTARTLVVDGIDNVIVTGWSAGSGGNFDYATIKYSGEGVPLWTNRYDGPGIGSDQANALAVDSSNNVIVTGWSYGSAGNLDYATIKYSSDGAPLWTNRYNGPGNGDDQAYALAVDSNDNVIVTGVSVGSGGTYDYATIAYSSEGVPLWTNRYPGTGTAYQVARAVAVDSSNSVIVTGSKAAIKYSSEGVPLWTNLYSGTFGFFSAAAGVVDANDDVVVTGSSLSMQSGADYGVIKYSSAGLTLWTNRYNGPGNGDDTSYAVALDKGNNVVITGWSVGSGGDLDYATLKYSSAGVPLWTNRYNGPGNGDDGAGALAVDRSGNLIVSGWSRGSGGSQDFCTVKYASPWPPVLSGLLLTNGAFQMQVVDVLQPGTLVIEACTDLAGWLPIFTNTTPTNMLFYTDPDATNYPGRFYRAYQSP